MNHPMNSGVPSRASIFGLWMLWQALCLLLAAVLTTGCAHSRDAEQRAGAAGGYLPPEPPAFLSGPLAVVLTNMGGFSAHVVMQSS